MTFYGPQASAGMDLRRFVPGPGHEDFVFEDIYEPLNHILRWMTKEDVPGVPHIDVVYAQANLLSDNMKTDITDSYNGCARPKVACHRWHCMTEDEGIRSGTIIQKNIWTLPRLSSQSPAFLRVYNHCMLKTTNEVVVEGMCKLISKQADKGYACVAMLAIFLPLNRPCISFLTRYANEAKIVWNGPFLHEVDEFLKECLNHYFGEGKKWHFFSNNNKQRRPLVSFVSKVIDRLIKWVSNFHFMKT